MSNITPSGGSTISSETENQIKGPVLEKLIINLIRRDKPAYLWHKGCWISLITFNPGPALVFYDFGTRTRKESSSKN
jgi:hypothetical protein